MKIFHAVKNDFSLITELSLWYHVNQISGLNSPMHMSYLILSSILI